MKFYIIDANVILLAGTSIKMISKEQLDCFGKCVMFLEKMKKDKAVIYLGDGGRILKEYNNAYSFNSYPRG